MQKNTADSSQPAQQNRELQAQPSPAMTRRGFLKISGRAVLGWAAVTALTAHASAPGAAAAYPLMTDAAATTPASTPTLDEITGRLIIPPLLVPEVHDGTTVFNLTLQRGQSQFLPGRTTATYGMNGAYLGPTLRARQGDNVLINVTNHLGESTTIHWHGMHLEAMMDGGPHQVISDNTTWSPTFTIQQPAATLWYHPHMMGQTLRQVGMGMAGLFILDDTNPVQASLPHTYGVDDIPVIFQDQTFGANGQFIFNNGRGGRGGGGGGQVTTLVNGTISPTISTGRSRLRLRLLNASSQRIYTFGFANNEVFYQVASDGGLLPAPVAMTRLSLAPGERAEIVVDVTPARSLVLQSFGGNGGGRGGNAQSGPLLTINTTGAATHLEALPAQLNSLERLSVGSAVQTRNMVLGGNDRFPTINGQSMTSMADMMNLANALRVKLGATEVWNLINRSGDTHAFHVHDIQFQIVDRNGVPPAANEAGLKDTVMVRPRETVRIIMRFTDFADPDTPYMYHCHLLTHEDNGMMGQFVVVAH